MNNETEQLENDVRRGQQAEQLMNHPLLKGWFVARKASLFESFTATRAGDDEARRLVWLKMQVVDELEVDLRDHIDTGKMATSTLKRIFDAMKRKR